MWKRGLNFSKKKYKLIDDFSFTPALRSNFRATVPRKIIENFRYDPKIPGVILVKVLSDGIENIRIKKLHNEGNSYTISLKAERGLKNLKVQVIKIQSLETATSRSVESRYDIINFIPTETRSNTNSPTPIYIFRSKQSIIAGGYYKKELILKDKIEFNKNTLSALGLYFTDGGKTASSFTNSWPQAINSVLDFLETQFSIDRKKVKASICCNYDLRNKKSALESFWKSQTGVSNFSGSLHFNKIATSPWGILELYFCNITLKEILLQLMKYVFNYKIDKTPLIQGILSGDGSPILQNRYVITHHVSSEKTNFNLNFIKQAFSDFNLKAIPGQPKLTLYTKWDENRELMALDPYKFNLKNRVKFAKYFLTLPKTIGNTDLDIRALKNEVYDKAVDDLIDHYRIALNFDLIPKETLEGVINGCKLS